MTDDYDINADEPKLDGVKLTSRANREEQARQDIAYLTERPEFIRWLLTVAAIARIDDADYHVDSAVLGQNSGRRIVWFEALKALREVQPRVELFLAAEKTRTQDHR